MDSTMQASERELVITRVVNAPRELVWQAWNDPQHVSSWWGPNGFSTTTYSKEVRVGGEWRFTMHGPDGTDYENRIVYTAVEQPARLAYDHFGAGDNESPHFKASTEFTEVAGGTEITLRMVFPTAQQRDAVAEYAIPGGQQTLARFAQHVEQR